MKRAKLLKKKRNINNFSFSKGKKKENIYSCCKNISGFCLAWKIKNQLLLRKKKN